MLEKPITWNGLNVNSWPRKLNLPPYYFYKVESVDGLWGQDVRTETSDLPHRHGSRTVGASYHSGKTLVISGTITAKDLTLLREAQRALQEACWNLDEHSLTFWLWNEVEVEMLCRVNQKLDMPEEQAQL